MLSNLHFVKTVKEMIKKVLLLSLLIPLCSFIHAQSIYLKSGTYDVSEIEKSNLYFEDDELFEDVAFRIIVFEELPTSDQKKSLEEAGIILLDYLPRNAFFAAVQNNLGNIDLTQFAISNIIDVDPTYKTAKELSSGNIPSWAILEGQLITVVAKYYNNLEDAKVLSDLQQKNLIIIDSGI